MIAYLRSVAERLAALYKREPARVNHAVGGVVTGLALRFGFQVDDHLVVLLVPIVLSSVAGEFTRAKVSPQGRA